MSGGGYGGSSQFGSGYGGPSQFNGNLGFPRYGGFPTYRGDVMMVGADGFGSQPTNGQSGPFGTVGYNPAVLPYVPPAQIPQQQPQYDRPLPAGARGMPTSPPYNPPPPAQFTPPPQSGQDVWMPQSSSSTMPNEGVYSAGSTGNVPRGWGLVVNPNNPNQWMQSTPQTDAYYAQFNPWTRTQALYQTGAYPAIKPYSGS